jgi:hypothetical protein
MEINVYCQYTENKYIKGELKMSHPAGRKLCLESRELRRMVARKRK